jgi:hypothetical protein
MDYGGVKKRVWGRITSGVLGVALVKCPKRGEKFEVERFKINVNSVITR